MENNDVLRRIRYIFDYGDDKMISIFDHMEFEISRTIISAWLKKDDDPEMIEMSDVDLAIFLDGLIIEKRGRRDGPLPEPETELNNNIILRKLKIALDFKTDQMLHMYGMAGKRISPHELSAFLRNPKQKQYRHCNDQYLRQFLTGLKKNFRKDSFSGE